MLKSVQRPTLLDVLIRGTPEPPEHVRRDMLGMMYSRFHSYKVPIAVMTLLTTSLAFAVLALNGVTFIVGVWFVVLLFVSGVMFKSGLRKLDFDPRDIRSGRFIGRAERASFLLGAVWSSVCFINPVQDMVAQVVLVALTMGMACGAVLFTAPLVGVGIRYLQATLMVVVLAAIMWHNEWVYVISLFGFALTAGLCVSAMSFYNSTTELVESSHESGKMATLLEQSLENATYGFAIFGLDGHLLASNSYHRDHFASKRGRDFKIGRREVMIDGDRWLVQNVSEMPNGHIMVSHTDISRQKEVERNLRELHDEIQQTEQARVAFISQASASIETPARFIRALASAFTLESRISFSPEERGRLASELEREADRLIAMIQTLRESVLQTPSNADRRPSMLRAALAGAMADLECVIEIDAEADAANPAFPADLFGAAVGASAAWVSGDSRTAVRVSAKRVDGRKLELCFRSSPRPAGEDHRSPDAAPLSPIKAGATQQTIHELWLALASEDAAFEASGAARMVRVILPLAVEDRVWNFPPQQSARSAG